MYRLLLEDKSWIEARIAYLQEKIQDLGPEFHEALNQSSETWHDNAPFDAVRDKQSLLYAEYSNLKYILLNSETVKPSIADYATIGSTVKLSRNGRVRTYFIAGDWAHNVGQHNQSCALVTSSQSPLAKALLGKKLHAETQYGTITDLN